MGAQSGVSIFSSNNNVHISKVRLNLLCAASIVKSLKICHGKDYKHNLTEGLHQNHYHYYNLFQSQEYTILVYIQKQFFGEHHLLFHG